VGKIAISDLILLKPAKLTPEEFESMKSHTKLGAQILSGGRFALLQLAEQIALTHHERWDGSGYLGLCEEAIPIAGRIVAVADVFDALTSDRPYKKAWPIHEAIEEIKRQSGRQFDPRVVEAFLKVVCP
jgi:putative two-component system response regulator